jgi:hypothetical protein
LLQCPSHKRRPLALVCLLTELVDAHWHPTGGHAASDSESTNVTVTLGLGQTSFDSRSRCPTSKACTALQRHWQLQLKSRSLVGSDSSALQCGSGVSFPFKSCCLLLVLGKWDSYSQARQVPRRLWDAAPAAGRKKVALAPPAGGDFTIPTYVQSYQSPGPESAAAGHVRACCHGGCGAPFLCRPYQTDSSCSARTSAVSDVIGHCRPFDRKGVSDRVDELWRVMGQTPGKPLYPFGVL